MKFKRVRVRVRVRNINLAGLLQFMSLTSENWKSFYNSFLYEKRTVKSGVEPPTSNLQLSTQSTKPLSHVKKSFLTLIHVLRFLDISLCLDISGHFLDIFYARNKTLLSYNLRFIGLGLGLETLTLKSFSSSCLSPLQTGSHSTTPSSLRKELLSLE